MSRRCTNESCDKKRRFAWAKYFESLREEVETVHVIYRTVEGIDRENLPSHISREFIEMADKLKRKFTCPVCLELVTTENVSITMCGHIYCEGCLAQVKQNTSMCSICRKRI